MTYGRTAVFAPRQSIREGEEEENKKKMAENKLKQPKTATPKRQSKLKKQPAFMNGLNMSAFYLFNNIHFIFYLAFLGIIYIANSHYAVQTIKEIKGIQSELRSISWESNSKKSDLMYQSMESIVAKKVQKMGLKELETNPKKIINKSVKK